MLHSNPDLVLVTDGSYTTIEPRKDSLQDKLSEHDLQAAVITECDRRSILRPEYGLIFAIPNGGHRHPAVAAKLKAEGVRPGVLDLFLPVARHGWHGFFIELKVDDNKPSEAQLEWKRNLTAEGYLCHIVYDHVAEVIGLIEWYLEKK
jgi:hypothetical protein